MRNVPSLETVARDYAPKGVQFFYIYKSLAHPGTHGYIAPFTLQERLMHIAEAKRKLGSRIGWLCDTMSNDLKHALGDAPNSEFIIDPEGKIVRARRWSRPAQLRKDLEELVGKVDKPTTVADLKMKPLEPPKTAKTGVVARLQLPGRLVPVKLHPVAGSADEPFYVKLRAEIEPRYFQTAKGKLYLGFFLDPLYKVHWNNRAAPVAYELEVPGGITITPKSGKGPTVGEDADADPREFLVDVSGKTDAPIVLTVRYVACDDAETFCKPVTQRYEISLERDPDGGSRRVPGKRPRPAAGARPAQHSGAGGATEDAAPRSAEGDPPQARSSRILRRAVAVFKTYDTNGDGRLDQGEWRKMKTPPVEADADRDTQVTLQELIDYFRSAAIP